MFEDTRPIYKKKSYAGPNLAESGFDRDRAFGGVMSSSYYYAWFSGQFFH